MKRHELIEKASHDHYNGVDARNGFFREGFKGGAKWADENPSEEVAFAEVLLNGEKRAILSKKLITRYVVEEMDKDEALMFISHLLHTLTKPKEDNKDED